MAILDELHYRHKAPSPLQRLVQLIARSRPGAWLFALVLPRADRVVLRLTGRRQSLTSIVAGLPVLELVTTGSRTGRPRTALVLGVPFGELVAVAGANFGQRRQPAWVGNLLAHPAAHIGYRGRRIAVLSRLATDAEYSLIQSIAASVYPGSASYVVRITARPLRTFVLDAAREASEPSAETLLVRASFE